MKIYRDNNWASYSIGDKTVIFANDGKAFLVEVIEDVTFSETLFKDIEFVEPSDYSLYLIANSPTKILSGAQWFSLMVGFTPGDVFKDLADFIKGEDIITGDKINRWL